MAQNNTDNKIENRIYQNTFTVMLMNELSNIGSGFIDTLLVSSFLDETALAAQGLVHPFFSFVGMVSALLIYGTQKLSISHLGDGNKEKAQKFFNTTFFASLGIGILVSFALIFFSGPVVSLMGADSSEPLLYTSAQKYLIGLAVGAIPLILIPILTPIIQVEGYKQNIQISLTIILVFNSILDFVAGFFQLGMLWFGLATGIAQWIGFIFICLPFGKKTFFGIHIINFDIKDLAPILKEGMPKVIKRLCKLVKPLTVNAMIMALGGVAAMSSVSIRNSFSGLFESVGTAVGGCVGMLSSLYVGERNALALKRLTSVAKKTLLFMLIPLCVLVFVFAGQFALLYADASSQIYGYVVKAIRCVGIDLIFMAMIEMLMNYWQSLGKIKEIGIITVLNKLILPLGSLVLLCIPFGIDGIWYSFPVSSFLSVISFLIISIIDNLKHKRKSANLMFAVPENMQQPKQIEKEIIVLGLDEISSYSEMIQQGCLACGIDRKRAYHVALCFEEVVCNIIDHGFKKDRKKHHVDAYFSVDNNEVTLRIRDDCIRFDMVEKFKIFHPEQSDPLKLIGIRMVMKLAKEVRYVNTFNTNSVIIKI